MLRLHDTAAGAVVDVEPSNPGRFGLYVCGPTVYDVPHLGHGRAVLVYDVLRRFLEWSGLEVTHVSNITDVEDKIVERAARDGRTAADVAAQYEAVWWEAVDRMGVLRPHHAPRATEYVEPMIDLVGRLVSSGKAYRTPDGVYFDARSVPDYGVLARQSLESMRAGARVEAVTDKRTPHDFALWKVADDEPNWDSPFGRGRPGWHTECVVMSLDLLGDGFDLHTGGLDLAFPHHENERVQALADGHVFALHWMHHAFVEVAGEKMSKSLGNYTSLTDMLERTDARAYRLLVLQSHYRTPLEVTPEAVSAAEGALRRLDNAAARFPEAFAGTSATPADDGVTARFAAALGDDLDTPAALRLVFEQVAAAHATADAGDGIAAEKAAVTAARLAEVVGLTASGGLEDDAEAVDAGRRIDEARAARDFAAADALRAEWTARGWVVENTPGGTRMRRAR